MCGVRWNHLFAIVLGLSLGAVRADAGTVNDADFPLVPGVVISYIESPNRTFGSPTNEVYVASPSITVMPDGSYIATHDLFYGTGNTNNRTTWVFRSTDKGDRKSVV